MGRVGRVDVGGMIYHVLNRANFRSRLFKKHARRRKEEIENIRYAIKKSRPYGSEKWVSRAVARFGLGSTLRERGRPRKGT
jgi:hypothetical protein